MTETFNTINGFPIWWTDDIGVTHACEGADVHRDVRLLWTKCSRDVPANAARTPEPSDKLTCPACLGAAR